MNGSDVRKFIKQGEQATEVLNKLGYTYSAKEGEHPHWIAPEDPQDALKAGIQALIDMGIKEGVAKAVETLKAQVKGPNWHLVAPMVGKLMRVRPENVPLWSPLREYGSVHFVKNYRANRIEYIRTAQYTGYAVFFEFQLRPFRAEDVWLPLSAVAFSN